MIESALAHTQNNEPAVQGWNKAVRHTAARMSHHNERTAGPIPAFGTMVHNNIDLMNTYSVQEASTRHNQTTLSYEAPKQDDEGFSFFDVIDMINPLQHLPVIGTLYRKLTGDQIGHLASVVGGTLFGGPVGAASSVANIMIKESTGRDVGDNILALAGLAPERAEKKPSLSYERSIPSDSSKLATGAQMAIANNSYSTVKNFASTKYSEQRWNA
jgi:hypothetical protein